MTTVPFDAEPDGSLASSSEPWDEARQAAVLADLARWRNEALRRAVLPPPARQAELAELRQRVAELETELAAQRRTVSWRVTRPLRAARRLAR